MCSRHPTSPTCAGSPTVCAGRVPTGRSGSRPPCSGTTAATSSPGTATADPSMPGADDPLRVVLVGAGLMGQAWLDAVAAQPAAQLVGVVDLDLPAARAAAERTGTPGLPIGTDLVEVARTAG